MLALEDDRLLGPTASGKSALAVGLARRFSAAGVNPKEVVTKVKRRTP